MQVDPSCVYWFSTCGLWEIVFALKKKKQFRFISMMIADIQQAVQILS